jgi:thiazole synthase ThiGH ThiG subunit
MQAGKNRHEHIMESLELFGREVLPEFHGHHAAHEAWKAKVMNREIELEEIETAAFKDRYGNKAMPAQVKPQKAGASG